MEQNCSLCGNYDHNAVWRGGCICRNCLDIVRSCQVRELRIPYLEDPESGASRPRPGHDRTEAEPRRRRAGGHS